MKQRYGLTLIFIAHDPRVVKNVSDRIVVIPRQAVRGRSAGLALHRSGPPVHFSAALCDPGSRSGGVHPDRRGGLGRTAVASRTALRLSLPHPLPASGAAMRRRGTATAAGAREQGSLRGLSLPFGRRGRGAPGSVHGRSGDRGSAVVLRSSLTGGGAVQAHEKTRTRLDPEPQAQSDRRSCRPGVLRDRPRRGHVRRDRRSGGRIAGTVVQLLRRPCGTRCRGVPAHFQRAERPPQRHDRPGGATGGQAPHDRVRLPALRPWSTAAWRLLQVTGALNHPAVQSARQRHMERLAAAWGADGPEGRTPPTASLACSSPQRSTGCATAIPTSTGSGSHLRLPLDRPVEPRPPRHRSPRRRIRRHLSACRSARSYLPIAKPGVSCRRPASSTTPRSSGRGGNGPPVAAGPWRSADRTAHRRGRSRPGRRSHRWATRRDGAA